MSQPGPQTDAMRIHRNHMAFCAVSSDDIEALAAELVAALDELGLKPGSTSRERWADFRQGAPSLQEVALVPAPGGWTEIVPASNDEELLALLGLRLSRGREALAIAWYDATGYRYLARFVDGALRRHLVLYSGELVHSQGEALAAETYDMNDFTARLTEAPDALLAWMRQQGVDPNRDRTRSQDGQRSILRIAVQGKLSRRSCCERYLAEVDSSYQEIRSELARAGG